MEELRQASVELMGTAYHTGCGIQHSLQFVGRRFRRARQDCVAVVKPTVNKNNFVFNNLEVFVITYQPLTMCDTLLCIQL